MCNVTIVFVSYQISNYFDPLFLFGTTKTIYKKTSLIIEIYMDFFSDDDDDEDEESEEEEEDDDDEEEEEGDDILAENGKGVHDLKIQ